MKVQSSHQLSLSSCCKSISFTRVTVPREFQSLETSLLISQSARLVGRLNWSLQSLLSKLLGGRLLQSLLSRVLEGRLLRSLPSRVLGGRLLRSLLSRVLGGRLLQSLLNQLSGDHLLRSWLHMLRKLLPEKIIVRVKVSSVRVGETLLTANSMPSNILACFIETLVSDCSIFLEGPRDLSALLELWGDEFDHPKPFFVFVDL